jgi:hypothetical protein
MLIAAGIGFESIQRSGPEFSQTIFTRSSEITTILPSQNEYHLGRCEGQL